jgi:hypothetical protein
MNGKVLMLAIIFLGGFHVFYVFNRVQNFANIMYRLCVIQLGECHVLTDKLFDFTYFGILRNNLLTFLSQNFTYFHGKFDFLKLRYRKDFNFF